MVSIQSIVAAVTSIIMLMVSLVTGGVPGGQDNQTVIDPAHLTNNTTITPHITALPSASPSPAPIAVKHSGDPQVDNFIDITCAPFTHGLKDPVTWRWSTMTNPSMVVMGQPTQEDRKQIQASTDVIYDKLLVAYSGLDFDVKEEYISGYDVIIYIGPSDRFNYFLSYYDNDQSHVWHPYSAGDYDMTKGGYRIWKDSKSPWDIGDGTCNAVIVLSDTNLTQEQRSYYIWKYMASIMGAHGTSKNSDSIFYSTPNWRTGYSGEDMWVLNTLYAKNGNVLHDFTADMVIQALVEHKKLYDIVNLDSHSQTYGG
jgi:hypothetical protein